MQALGITPSGHHAAGELVDDDDLVTLDDVVLVALEQLVGLQRLIDVMDHRHVLDVVKRAIDHACLDQKLFDVLVAVIGQRDLALLFVEFEVFGAAAAERTCLSKCRAPCGPRRGRK